MVTNHALTSQSAWSITGQKAQPDPLTDRHKFKNNEKISLGLLERSPTASARPLEGLMASMLTNHAVTSQSAWSITGQKAQPDTVETLIRFIRANDAIPSMKTPVERSGAKTARWRGLGS